MYIPTDILEHIISVCDFKTICVISCVSKLTQRYACIHKSNYMKYNINPSQYIRLAVSSNTPILFRDILSYQNPQQRKSSIIECVLLCIHKNKPSFLKILITNFKYTIYHSIDHIIAINKWPLPTHIFHLLITMCEHDKETCKALYEYQKLSYTVV